MMDVHVLINSGGVQKEVKNQWDQSTLTWLVIMFLTNLIMYE